MQIVKVVLSGEQQKVQPVWRTNSKRKSPLCPICKQGWCDLNRKNYLECNHCHVQFKDVTNAKPGMTPVDALQGSAVGMHELPTFTNDDASTYEGSAYQTGDYLLIPRLDVQIVKSMDPNGIMTQVTKRPANDPRRKEYLLGKGDYA